MENNLSKFEVVAEAGVALPTTDGQEQAYAQGAIIELNPTDERVVALVNEGAIKAVEADEELAKAGDECVLEGGEKGIISPEGVCVPLTKPEQMPKEGDVCEIGGVMGKFNADLVCIPDSAPAQEAETAAVVSDEPQLVYEGKKVIAHSEREVNGATFVSVRLEDGSTHDLSPTEFEEVLQAAKTN